MPIGERQPSELHVTATELRPDRLLPRFPSERDYGPEPETLTVEDIYRCLLDAGVIRHQAPENSDHAYMQAHHALIVLSLAYGDAERNHYVFDVHPGATQEQVILGFLNTYMINLHNEYLAYLKEQAGGQSG
jgi:hypothetical protein